MTAKTCWTRCPYQPAAAGVVAVTVARRCPVRVAVGRRVVSPYRVPVVASRITKQDCDADSRAAVNCVGRRVDADRPGPGAAGTGDRSAVDRLGRGRAGHVAHVRHDGHESGAGGGRRGERRVVRVEDPAPRGRRSGGRSGQPRSWNRARTPRNVGMPMTIRMREDHHDDHQLDQGESVFLIAQPPQRRHEHRCHLLSFRSDPTGGNPSVALRLSRDIGTETARVDPSGPPTRTGGTRAIVRRT